MIAKSQSHHRPIRERGYRHKTQDDLLRIVRLLVRRKYSIGMLAQYLSLYGFTAPSGKVNWHENEVRELIRDNEIERAS